MGQNYCSVNLQERRLKYVKSERMFFGTKTVLLKQLQRLESRNCGTKIRLKHKKHAMEVCRMMEKRHEENFSFYKCKDCRHYHVGHTPKWLLKQEALERTRKEAELKLKRKQKTIRKFGELQFWNIAPEFPFLDTEDFSVITIGS